MRELQERLGECYSAARSPGAGGGGAFLFYTFERDRLIKKFEKISGDYPDVKLLPFKIDYDGLRIEDC